MRVIFSRKGFDTDNGSVPCPIVPAGLVTPKPEPIFFPIPREEAPISYREIKIKGVPIGSAVEQLTTTGLAIPAYYRAHLDPDLNSNSVARLPNWLPTFGSTQGHLREQKIKEGDLFLFYGVFRLVDVVQNSFETRWSYKKGSKRHHVLFGWLQIGEVIHNVNPSSVISAKPWLYRHPHLSPEYYERQSENSLFIARPVLNLEAGHHDLAGAGMFSGLQSKSNVSYILSDQSQSDNWRHSHWRLPGWCVDPNDFPDISYHRAKDWVPDGTDWLLKTTAPGQEFVLNLRCQSQKLRQAILNWLVGLFV